MFIFDTNVLSEVMKVTPHPAVAAWLRGCPSEMMFTTSITYGEILHGIRRLPEGARRRQLSQAANAMFKEFDSRILPFDIEAADAYADLRTTRARVGRPLTTEDGMIGAIAKVHGATVVTRDVGGFDSYGVAVLNPWPVN